MENPVKIYSSNRRYELEVLKAKLEEHKIGSYIMDKQDSAYIVIGDAELFVEKDHLEKAKEILQLD